MRKSWGESIRPLALVLALVLAACQGAVPDGDSDDEAEATTTTAAESAEVPNPEVMIVTTDDEPATLDPAQIASTDVGRSGIFQVYDRLVDIPADSTQVAPSLATEVPTPDNGLISADGLTYTFPIREGVTFHDGTELTAEDVKYSWDRVVEMELPEGQSEIFDNVAETRVVDDYTFEVTLENVDAFFLSGVAASVAASVVSPEAVEANGGVVAGQPNEFIAQNMVGTGPYSFVEWNRGERLDFDVFEDYWGEPAHLPVRWLPLVKEAGAGMMAGEYDVIFLTAADVPGLQGVDNLVLETDQLGLQVLEIGFNMKIDPDTLPEEDTIPADFFHDVRVRQAFNYAFDYEGFLQGVLDGLGDRGSFVLPQGMAGYDPEAPIYEHDPERAEELFREAGWWEEGFTLSILADQTSNEFLGSALTLKDSIEALNPRFHVNVQGVPEARFDEMVITDPMPAAMWSYTSPELRNPAEYMFNGAHPDGTWGSIAGFENGYSDPEQIASLIEEARTELDPDRRLEIYSELQHLLYEEAMWVMPAQEVNPLGYGEWMEGVVSNPMWPRPTTRWALYDK